MPLRAPPRTNDLALIHIAKAQLGMPDDQYRDLVFTIGRVRSAKDLDWAGRQKLLDHFRKCGFKAVAKGGKASEKPANEWHFVFRATPARQVHLKKLFRLCQAIGALQAPSVPVMSKAWVEGILKQMLGANADVTGRPAVHTPLEMACPDDLHALVQALEMHRKRLVRAVA